MNALSPDRLPGLLSLVLGAITIGINEHFIRSEGTFYPKLYILAGVLIPIGLFGLPFGIPKERRLEGQPLRYRIGFIAVAVAGALVSLAYTIQIGA